MNYTFSDITQDGDAYRANFLFEDGSTISFPFVTPPSQEEANKKISEYLWGQELLAEKGEDRVYNNGVLVRVDAHNKGSSSVGIASGIRAPYNQQHVSTYFWGFPSEELLDQWGVFDRNDLVDWYAIKATDDGRSFFKLFRYAASWPNEPSFSSEVWVYASVFSEDGTESDIKDVYVKISPEEMRQWCFNNNCTYPLPPEETKKPWCYGVYWNSTTGVIEGVKGYVRYT